MEDGKYIVKVLVLLYFLLLSLFNKLHLCFLYEKLFLSFLLLHLFQVLLEYSYFGFACWSPEASDDNHFDPGLLCFTISGFILICILDFFFANISSKEINMFAFY